MDPEFVCVVPTVERILGLVVLLLDLGLLGGKGGNDPGDILFSFSS